MDDKELELSRKLGERLAQLAERELLEEMARVGRAKTSTERALAGDGSVPELLGRSPMAQKIKGSLFDAQSGLMVGPAEILRQARDEAVAKAQAARAAERGEEPEPERKPTLQWSKSKADVLKELEENIRKAIDATDAGKWLKELPGKPLP